MIGGEGKAYQRGPSEACVLGVMLIEDVEKVEGMRGRRRWAVYGSRIDACVMEALVGADASRPGMNLRV